MTKKKRSQQGRGVRVNLQDPHESKVAMSACPQAMSLHISRKNILPPSSAHPCSRACLQSLALVLIRFQLCKAPLQHPELSHQRNVPFLARSFTTPVHLALTRTHERRHILRLQSSCQWNMPARPRLTSKMEKTSTIKYDHATSAAISRHPSYMQVVSALRYVTPSSPISI